MTTIAPRLTGDDDAVKSELLSAFERVVDWLFHLPVTASQLDVEREVWRGIQTLGAMLFAAVLTRRCRGRAQAELAGREPGTWRFRLDEDYSAHLTTTFGRIAVPTFAWRELTPEGREVTRVPDLADTLPLRGRCRSTLLLLSWECRAGAESPYRRAADTLSFFTGGAVQVEDTTISAHLFKVGALVDRSWQYRTPEETRQLLLERATRGRDGRPILYVSSDACALRRFVDETTAAAWKMANGLRVWAVDRHDGSTIHLGGEYTWGDCEVVSEILEDLDRRGILPRDGRYGDVRARVVVVTDGAPWLQERVVPWFPDAEQVLDLYHLLERLAADAKAMFGEGTAKARGFVARVRGLLLGRKAARDDTPKLRKGHRKGTTRSKPTVVAGPEPARDDGQRLLDAVQSVVVPAGSVDVKARLVQFLRRNLDRMHYRLMRWQGVQVGSGAMESLHRTAVQCRIKLPGARWLPETSARVFAMRMMALVGRWEEFWAQPDLGTRLAAAFGAKSEVAP